MPGFGSKQSKSRRDGWGFPSETLRASSQKFRCTSPAEPITKIPPLGFPRPDSCSKTPSGNVLFDLSTIPPIVESVMRRRLHCMGGQKEDANPESSVARATIRYQGHISRQKYAPVKPSQTWSNHFFEKTVFSALFIFALFRVFCGLNPFCPLDPPIPNVTLFSR
jgi:hypothetical protein